MRAVEAALPETLAKNHDAAGSPWAAGAALSETLLGNDPIAIVTALEEALRAGASPHPPLAPLIDTLAFAAVREDIDFHCLQVIEVSARQCAAWGEGPEIEEILVGAVRNLAAHCPTRRAGQQTARIALRLHRGDAIFEEETPEASESSDAAFASRSS